ncbi:MAG TPA: hypothetical protein VG013_03330 [Gemmataceae bacterium]|jgi:hypothetical protein|nr:hypothetical protein [Gemmataceae bacterium]
MRCRLSALLTEAKAPQGARRIAAVVMGEVAEGLGMSLRSAHEVWAYAHLWRRRDMRPG